MMFLIHSKDVYAVLQRKLKSSTQGRGMMRKKGKMCLGHNNKFDGDGGMIFDCFVQLR